MNKLRKFTKDKLLEIIRNQEQSILCKEMQIRSRENEIEQLELKVLALSTTYGETNAKKALNKKK